MGKRKDCGKRNAPKAHARGENAMRRGGNAEKRIPAAPTYEIA